MSPFIMLLALLCIIFKTSINFIDSLPVCKLAQISGTFYKRNKKLVPRTLYKHLGIFKNTREVHEARAVGTSVVF